MYAEILDDLIEEKAYLFEVGKVYIIKKFVVDSAKATYKAVDKRLMIQITEFTTAEIVSDPPRSIPDYIYRISPFSIIKPQQVVYTYTGKLHIQTVIICSSSPSVCATHRCLVL